MLIKLVISAAYPVRDCGGFFLLVHSPFLQSVLLTLGDKVQNGLKMEKPRSLYLAGFADADTAEVPLPSSLVKFSPAEASVKFHATAAWRSYPNGKSVMLVVKQFPCLGRYGSCGLMGLAFAAPSGFGF